MREWLARYFMHLLPAIVSGLTVYIIIAAQTLRAEPVKEVLLSGAGFFIWGLVQLLLS